MTLSLIVALALYTLGLFHSILGFFQKRQIFVKIALGMASCGFIAHTVFLILLVIQLNHFPVTNLQEALCFFAWCVSLTFIAADFRHRMNVLGAFILPLVALLMMLSQIVWQEKHPIPGLLNNGWIYFHSTAAFLAYAAFFLTFVSGILFLVQENELKAKNFRFFYFHLPSLQACDELFRNSLFVGFFAMTLAIISGAVWAHKAWGNFWNWDPKETAALATWAIYCSLVSCRFFNKWHGRRAAYISIIGFAAVVITLGINWGLHAYL
jgi:cytochrome c-type biogenesis protein CcsB